LRCTERGKDFGRRNKIVENRDKQRNKQKKQRREEERKKHEKKKETERKEQKQKTEMRERKKTEQQKKTEAGVCIDKGQNHHLEPAATSANHNIVASCTAVYAR